MCIFSQHVEHVAQTKIFARAEGGEQLLAYEMAYSALGDLAMVLPVPVVPGSGEQAMRFIDLSLYPDIFRDLSKLFPEAVMAGVSGSFSRSAQAPTLIVHQVGSFEASFVPTLADFARLDPRFRLPAEVWTELPQYRDFGFAVFKLRGQKRGFFERLGLKAPSAPAPTHVHPMAFAFHSRTPSELFFPTVHVHDGRVHGEAHFDHELYCQLETAPGPHGVWHAATGNIAHSVSIERSSGLLHAFLPCFRLRLLGTYPNQDQYARPAGPTPGAWPISGALT
jgi:hypothetical protein